MTLAEYLRQERGRAAALARTLDVQPSTVTRWASGDIALSWRRAMDIQRATGGAVTVADCLEAARSA